MSTYKIKISYYTGDSFGSQDTESYLELEWNDLEIAKENLKRIEEHYDYYEKIDREYSNKKKDILFQYKDKDWFVKDSIYSLKLKADNGNDWQLSAFWCGYFEGLYGASIESVGSGLSFNRRGY